MVVVVVVVVVCLGERGWSEVEREDDLIQAIRHSLTSIGHLDEACAWLRWFGPFVARGTRETLAQSGGWEPRMLDRQDPRSGLGTLHEDSW